MRVLRVRFKDKVFYAALHQVAKEDTHGGAPSAELFVQCLNKDLELSSPIPLNQCSVLPPVVPTKIICLAVNFRQHAEEMGHAIPKEPVLFLKPPSAIIGSGQPIILPSMSRQVDFEGELAIIIGKNCRNVAESKIPEHIFGFACANDVTARDLQRQDGQFGRAKGFDSFAPIGPWIETELDDPGNLELTTSVNGEPRQQGNTADMIFGPYEIVSRISRVMTLLPGDVILTGTPSGVGPLHHGDEVRVELTNLGTLINPVLNDSAVAKPAPDNVEDAGTSDNNAPIQ